MFRFCLLFVGVAFLEKLDTILRQKTAHFKTKNVHFNWIACAILRLKMSVDIVPLIYRLWPTVTWFFHLSVPRTTTKRFTLKRTAASRKTPWGKFNPEMSTSEQVQTAFSLLKDGQKIDTFFALLKCHKVLS